MDKIGNWAFQTIARGSKSFAFASRLFTPEMRRHAWLLYAWCRHCDDVVDGQEGGRGEVSSGDDAPRRIAELRADTEAALKGEGAAGLDAFSALATVASETGLPASLPAQHLDGFAMDTARRRYETIEDTLDYCHHVAGVVGAMMAIIMGVKPDDDAVLIRAADLGLAFQLTNICRDIVDDAADGRSYLPQEWLAEAGIMEWSHTLSASGEALHSVAVRMLDLADDYYESAHAGAAKLPFRARWAVLSAAKIYHAIGTKIRSAGSDAWRERQYVTKGEKLIFVIRAWREARAMDEAAPLPHRAALWKKGDSPEWSPSAAFGG